MSGIVFCRLTTGSGDDIACEWLDGEGPGIIFCPGFQSDMQGMKALALRQWCVEKGRQYSRFDYRGHGQSGGDITHFTLSHWLADTLQVIDELTVGPQLLVGSSMGGWLSLLAALERPERIAGLLLIAPAQNFTERIVNERMSEAQRVSLANKGRCELFSPYDSRPYIITRELLADGRQHRLGEMPIAIDAPVRIIHGQQDEAVPWQASIRLVEQLSGEDVELQLVKQGDHRLSGTADLHRMLSMLEQLVMFR
ncbi:MAG: alpha/beta hydrolase [Parahaliea sp.]